jgi:hypothetical protein
MLCTSISALFLSARKRQFALLASLLLCPLMPLADGGESQISRQSLKVVCDLVYKKLCPFTLYWVELGISAVRWIGYQWQCVVSWPYLSSLKESRPHDRINSAA